MRMFIQAVSYAVLKVELDVLHRVIFDKTKIILVPPIVVILFRTVTSVPFKKSPNESYESVHFDVSFNLKPKNTHDVTSPLLVNNDRNKLATKAYVSEKELLESH